MCLKGTYEEGKLIKTRAMGELWQQWTIINPNDEGNLNVKNPSPTIMFIYAVISQGLFQGSLNRENVSFIKIIKYARLPILQMYKTTMQSCQY